MNGNNKKDERQHWLLTESLAAAAFVAYFYGLFLLVFKLIKTKDIKNVYVELGLIIIMAITMRIHRIVNRNYDIPTTISGKILPIGYSKGDKGARIFYYIRDALVLSVLLTIFNFNWHGGKGTLFKISHSYLGVIIDGVLTFTFMFILNYLWHEHNVRRYNIYCDSLEQE